MRSLKTRPPGLRNALVWAARGSGKTQLGAIATLLDLLFKPGIEICILGGSFAQSSRMHQHLRRMLHDDVFVDLIEGRFTQQHVMLRNGSRVEAISQSHTAVRGRRVHRLRCDEVELFEPDVWEAAQMVTRSGRCGDVFVQAGVEALSTMHRPFGLMSRLTAQALRVEPPSTAAKPSLRLPSAAQPASGILSSTRLFRWSAIDVLEHCSAQRVCALCGLFESGCAGVAKRVDCRGFLRIDDAIDQRVRVSPTAWQSEMLCERPDVTDCVYPEFNEALHVFDDDFDNARKREGVGDGDGCDRAMAAASRTWIGGLDFGFRSPSVLLLATMDACNVLRVIDEIHERACTTQRMIELARARCDAWRVTPNWIGADPAGLSRNDQSGVSNITLWRRAGFAVRARSTTIESGIELVRARLASAATGDGPGLLVHRRCAHLVRALREYHFDPDREHVESPVKDGPDHAADALRYMVTHLDGGRAQRARAGDY